MFLGQFNHTLDPKSRLAIPKKFRQEIQNTGVLTRGLDTCLFLYTKNEWESLSNHIKELPLTAADARNFSRYLFSGAVEVSCDALGRITLPDYLRTYAHLDKNVVVIGVLNRVEIWDKQIWEVLNKDINEKGSELAEKLSGSGI